MFSCAKLKVQLWGTCTFVFFFSLRLLFTSFSWHLEGKCCFFHFWNPLHLSDDFSNYCWFRWSALIGYFLWRVTHRIVLWEGYEMDGCSAAKLVHFELIYLIWKQTKRKKKIKNLVLEKSSMCDLITSPSQMFMFRGYPVEMSWLGLFFFFCPNSWWSLGCKEPIRPAWTSSLLHYVHDKSVIAKRDSVWLSNSSQQKTACVCS